MTSKNLQQLDLLPKARPAPADVSVATVMRRPTFLRAIHLAIEVTGLEDKEVYDAIDIDASHWTRIKNGAAHFPCDERLIKFFGVVNNDIPLVWLCETLGYDSRSLRKHYVTDDARRVAELEDENAALRRIVARGRV